MLKLFWYILKPIDQAKLRVFQLREYGEKLNPPADDSRPITCDLKGPSLEEIDRTLREKPKQKRGKGW